MRRQIRLRYMPFLTFTAPMKADRATPQHADPLYELPLQQCSIAYYLRLRSEADGNRSYLTFGPRTYTFAETEQRCRDLARGLAQRGVRAGSRVLRLVQQGLGAGVRDAQSPGSTLTGGRGADVSFDPVGGDVFDAAMRSTAIDGRLLVVGFAGGRIPSAPANRILLILVQA
jgi:hypothetical protein